MSSKGNYSEVQKMDRASVLKKVLFITMLLVVLLVAILIIKALFSQKKEEATIAASKELTMVPTNINYYDPQAEKTYDVGTNYIILSDDSGFLKVSADGEVSRVSSDGTYLKDATEEEKQNAIKTAFTIIDKDNQASMALEGLKENAPQVQTETPAPQTTPLENLYKRVETLGYTQDDFLNKLSLAGSTPQDVVALVDSGIDRDTLIKSIMNVTPEGETKTNAKEGTEQKTEQVGMSANVEKVGLLEEPATNTETTVKETEYPSWLDDSDTDASMSALMTTLQSIASSSSSSNQTTEKTSWEKTNKQEEKSSWLTSQQSTELSSSRLTRYDLVAGTTVPITIVTGINTDLPGQVVGLVRQDVYDTLTGTNIIIPKGSRLMATYNNSVTFGQKSVQIAWTQLITTDGYQFTLPGFNGTTPDGYSGVSDKYSNHFWSMLGGAVFGSLLDWGAVYAESKAGTLVSGGELSSLLQALTGSAISTTSSVGQKYADLWLNLQPTIKIRTGTQTQLLVNQTISLKR